MIGTEAISRVIGKDVYDQSGDKIGSASTCGLRFLTVRGCTRSSYGERGGTPSRMGSDPATDGVDAPVQDHVRHARTVWCHTS